MKKFNFINSIIVSILIFFVVLGCGGLTKGKELGEKSVAKFHQQLAEEKYDEIYKNLDEEFKKVSTEQQTQELFRAVNKKLGKVKKATLQSWKSNATTSGSSTVLVFDTEFEQDKGVETFVLNIIGDEAKIMGYNVNSPAFIK